MAGHSALMSRRVVPSCCGVRTPTVRHQRSAGSWAEPRARSRQGELLRCPPLPARTTAGGSRPFSRRVPRRDVVAGARSAPRPCPTRRLQRASGPRRTSCAAGGRYPRRSSFEPSSSHRKRGVPMDMARGANGTFSFRSEARSAPSARRRTPLRDRLLNGVQGGRRDLWTGEGHLPPSGSMTKRRGIRGTLSAGSAAFHQREQDLLSVRRPGRSDKNGVPKSN